MVVQKGEAGANKAWYLNLVHFSTLVVFTLCQSTDFMDNFVHAG